MTEYLDVVKAAAALHDKNHEYKDALQKCVSTVAEFAESHVNDKSPEWLEFFMLFMVQAQNTLENCCDITKAMAIGGVQDERARNAENN